PLSHRPASEPGRGRSAAEGNAPAQQDRTQPIQALPLPAAEESLESHRRSKGALVPFGPPQRSDRAGLLLKGSLPAFLGLQAARPRRTTPPEMYELGHALPTGAIQELRPHATGPFGRGPRLD